MPIRLEFIGRDVIRRDPMKFLEQLRERFPNVSEKGLHAIAGAEFEKRKPRHNRHVVCLFGRDILSEDPTTIPAWPLMTADLRNRVLHPEQYQQTSGKRENLIDPVDLQTTYVWRHSADWIQEVSDHDAEVLRRSPARGWFRDVDRHGLYVPGRAWDFPVKERHEAPTLQEAAAIRRDLTRKKTWNGV